MYRETGIEQLAQVTPRGAGLEAFVQDIADAMPDLGIWSLFKRDAEQAEQATEAFRLTVLDFNEAYNPPCSFNPYTTCPIPPAENRLSVRILGGERDYGGKLPKP